MCSTHHRPAQLPRRANQLPSWTRAQKIVANMNGRGKPVRRVRRILQRSEIYQSVYIYKKVVVVVFVPPPPAQPSRRAPTANRAGREHEGSRKRKRKTREKAVASVSKISIKGGRLTSQYIYKKGLSSCLPAIQSGIPRAQEKSKTKNDEDKRGRRMQEEYKTQSTVTC